MKIVEKLEKKNRKIKKKPVVKPKKEKVLIVAQEIKFARLLSGNEKKSRDSALKTLKKWLQSCFLKDYEFKEEDFKRIWKGLFYAIWMSDKPLVQEELADNISGILDVFPEEKVHHALMMVRVGFKVLATEWYGIDHHRMDKCLMLVRRYLNASFRCVQRCGWSELACEMYASALGGKDGILSYTTPFYARNAASLISHIIECYYEELTKVSEGAIPPSSVCSLSSPLVWLVCGQSGGGGGGGAGSARRALTGLIRQGAQGALYEDKAAAWRRMGCPEGGPDALQLVPDSDCEEDLEEVDELSLAARLESVATSHRLPVDGALMAAQFRVAISRLNPASKARRRANICLKRFEQLAAAEYPLPVSAPPPESPSPRSPAKGALPSALALIDMEKKLTASADELAIRGLSRKHRKRLLAKSRAGLSIVEDLDTGTVLSNTSANGDWKIEDESENNKKKQNKKDKSKKRKLEKQNGDAENKKLKTNNVADGKVKQLSKQNVQQRQNKGNPLSNGLSKSKKNTKNAPSIIKESNKITHKVEKTDKIDSRNGTPELKSDTSKNSSSHLVNKAKQFQKQLSNNNNIDTSKNSPKRHVNNTKQLVTDKNTSKNSPTRVVNKIKKFQKQLSPRDKNKMITPKKVQFVLKNNSMQQPLDYYRSVRQSPNIPFDSAKVPSKTNLKPSTPSPINPFFKKKLRLK